MERDSVTMDKRAFLRLCTMAMSGPFLARLVSWAEGEKLSNWAGNVVYGTDRLYSAQSLENVQEFVHKTEKFKVLGTRHCFNRIADSDAQFLSLRSMDKIVALDPQAHTVTIESGISYGQLCPFLESKGFALHNLASLPHISVAGACGTATHGSGINNGNLATAVSGIEFVNAKGDIVRLAREKDGDAFCGAVVGLGALGVVTRLTLELQPTFQMQQYVYENLPLSELQTHFEAIESAAYSVSLFTHWRRPSINEVWLKHRMENGKTFDAPKDFYGAKRATKNLHPIAEISAENCTEQLGVPGPWYERLPHFRMGFTPSAGKELQSEYFVPRVNAVEAILAIAALREQVSPHLLITEIRTIAADDLWMSTAYKQDSVAIHFTWKPEWPEVSKLLPVIERELAPFQARPHWGKLFTMPPDRLRSHYTKLAAFQELAWSHDPKGKFRNEFLNKNLFD
jgi:xylitol oxidase